MNNTNTTGPHRALETNRKIDHHKGVGWHSRNDMVKVNRKDTSDPINVGRHRNRLGRKKNRIIKTFHISQQK